MLAPVTAPGQDTCARVAGMYVTNVTRGSADLEWEAVEGCTGYLYSVSKSVVPPARIGKFIKENKAEATGLGAAQTYYAHVRAVCPDAEVSHWATVQFNTPAPEGKRFELTDNTFAVSTYPSIAEESITVKVKGEVDEHASVEIRDVFGESVRTYPISGDRLHIEVANLPAGIYYVFYNDRWGRMEWMRFTK